LQDDSPEQLVLGAREKGWRDAESAIDRAKARFGRGSVRPGRLIQAESDEDEEDN
jgi:DNA polymerase-4